MNEEYHSLYNTVCCESHNNLRSLISRHIDLKKDDFEMVLYRELPLDRFLYVLDSTAGLLIEASLYLHEVYNSEVLNEVKIMFEKLESVQDKYIN